MNTVVRRIDLAAATNLETEIVDLCVMMANIDYHLASTFVHTNQLVLIFQK